MILVFVCSSSLFATTARARAVGIVRPVAKLAFPAQQITTSSSDMCLTTAAILSIKNSIQEYSASIDSTTKVCDFYSMLDVTLHHANWSDVFPESVVWFHNVVWLQDYCTTFSQKCTQKSEPNVTFFTKNTLWGDFFSL
jgi:hypothetical protein